MWNDTETPLAYFISFRSYGTWLHGDKRGSTDRFHNRYRTPHLPRNESWHRYNRRQLKTKPFFLRAKHRKAVREAIRETCEIRKWSLYALNVRSNHIHVVVAAGIKKSELVLGAFKANATANSERKACGLILLVPGQTAVASANYGMKKVSVRQSITYSIAKVTTCQILTNELGRHLYYARLECCSIGPPATAWWY